MSEFIISLVGHTLKIRSHAYFIFLVIRVLEGVVRTKTASKYGQHLVDLEGRTVQVFFGVKHNAHIVLRENISTDLRALAKLAKDAMEIGKVNTLQSIALRIYSKRAEEMGIKPIRAKTLEPIFRDFIKRQVIYEEHLYINHLSEEGLLPFEPIISIRLEPTWGKNENNLG